MQGSQAQTLETKVLHLWVGSFPFIDSFLIISPDPGCESPSSVSVRCFDPDGAFANEFSINIEPGAPGLIEIEPLLGSIKLEGGMKHAHLEIECPIGVQVLTRLVSREGAVLLGEPSVIDEHRSAFFPVQVLNEHSSMLCIVNAGDETSNLKCRLFLGSRTPDISLSIPARGSRIISLEAEFSEYLQAERGKIQQVYTRLGTRGGAPLTVQLFECFVGASGGDLFSAVS